MRVVVLDTETTGWLRSGPSDAEKQPHLVQLGAIVADTTTREVLSVLDVMIKPAGWHIPSAVVAVHGIDDATAKAHGVSERLATELFLDLWKGSPVIAHNVEFDLGVMACAIARYSSPAELKAWRSTGKFCTMEHSTPLVKKRKEGRKNYCSPKLGEAYKHLTGRTIEKAHSAYHDARACMEVYWKILDQQPGV